MTVFVNENQLADIEAVLVDVRSGSEFAAGHLAGSLNVPMEQLESRLRDLPRDRSVVLVCQSGRRAQLCAERLEALGWTPAVLAGGLDGCSTKGFVVSTVTRWSLERQVRLGAGLLVLFSFVLARLVDPAWLGLAAFVGVGLTFAGLTNICLLAAALTRMPWNRVRSNTVRQRAES